MYLLFDIGGTNIKIATSLDGKTISDPVIIPTSQDFEQGLEVLKQTTEKLVKGQKIQAVGVGIAGTLDAQHSMLVKSPHLKPWVNKPLKLKLAEVFQSETKLENDVALGGLGEANLGKYKDQKIIAYLAIGTGVGGVRIVDGMIDQSTQGFEPGHQIIIPNGNQCDCGGKGHLESYVAGAYLKEPISWDEVAKYLAMGLHNTIVHWSPNLIVLGGSVSQSISLDKVSKYLQEFLTIFPNFPPIFHSTLGSKAGLTGALKLITD